MKAVLGKAAVILLLPFLAAKAWLSRAREHNGSDPLKPKTWYRRLLEGTKCSDGSPYYVYFKKGESKNLIVYFSGGGAAWNQETAAQPMTWRTVIKPDGFYSSSLNIFSDLTLVGILEKSNPKNPFDSWNAIYIPYVSADMHVGNREFPYVAADGSKKILYHNGIANVKQSLAAGVSIFPEVDRLVIAGESAGAFACVAYAELASSLWPKASQVAIVSDSSSIWNPHWVEVLRDIWNSEEVLWQGLSGDGELIADWFERVSKNLPDALLLHYNSAFDNILSPFQHLLNANEFAVNETALKNYNEHLKIAVRRLSKLKNYSSFISTFGKDEMGSTPHTAARYPNRYYAKTPEGPSFAEWLDKACCQPGGMKNPGNVGDENL
ncbi:MAG: pectinacetylesterase family protein [Clostridiales bacterium]|nr:pectinacetylesterase family protein [Clostridiales bacterium]